jgi:hypothetical protein
MRYAKHTTIDLVALRQAREVLESAGYLVHTPPPELLEKGVLLAAHHPGRKEGHLLSPPEVRLVAYHGLAALDPEPTDPRPRWERPATRAREQAYAESALARAVLEVQSAPPGSRNNVLARVAFGLGRLEHLGLDRVRVLEALEEAALSTGLEHREALSTARRAWAKGAQHPRDLPVSDIPQKPVSETLTTPQTQKAGVSDTRQHRGWGKRSGWGGGR